MKRTGIVKHETYMEHVMDPGHPESPERLRAIYQMLEEKEMKGQFELISPARPPGRSSWQSTPLITSIWWLPLRASPTIDSTWTPPPVPNPTKLPSWLPEG